MDPLCEKYYDVSPYAYCANNPVRYIDPDGMIIRIYEGDKEEVYSLYEIGGSYGGKDVFTQTCFNLLNKLAENPMGKEVLESLNSSNSFFDVKKLFMFLKEKRYLNLIMIRLFTLRVEGS